MYCDIFYLLDLKNFLVLNIDNILNLLNVYVVTKCLLLELSRTLKFSSTWNVSVLGHTGMLFTHTVLRANQTERAKATQWNFVTPLNSQDGKAKNKFRGAR